MKEMKIKDLRNMILLGDAAEQLLKIPNNSIDVVVTSPPYFNLRDYKHKKQIGREETEAQYYEKLTKVFSQVKRVLKRRGSFFLNIGDKWDKGKPRRIPEKFFKILVDQLDWKFIHDIVWCKPNPDPRCSRRGTLYYSWEHIYWLGKASGKVYRNKVDLKKDWFEAAVTNYKPISKNFKGHSAPFPPPVPEFCIKLACPPGGIVLDPFFGYGTTGVAAIDHQAYYVGIELNPENYRECVARLEKLREGTPKVVDEEMFNKEILEAKKEEQKKAAEVKKKQEEKTNQRTGLFEP